jgi:octaprenyl-diphosphate synthase
VASGRNDMRETMKEFGELVGLAFQLKDDIFDYGTGEKIGKPTGLDIRERKMTLPLIYALNNAPTEVKRELLYIVKNKNEKSKSVKRAVEIVIQEGGVQYTHQRMMELTKKALDLLSTVPESPAKSALVGLVEYTTQREK